MNYAVFDINKGILLKLGEGGKVLVGRLKPVKRFGKLSVRRFGGLELVPEGAEAGGGTSPRRSAIRRRICSWISWTRRSSSRASGLEAGGGGVCRRAWSRPRMIWTTKMTTKMIEAAT